SLAVPRSLHEHNGEPRAAVLGMRCDVTSMLAALGPVAHQASGATYADRDFAGREPLCTRMSALRDRQARFRRTEGSRPPAEKLDERLLVIGNDCFQNGARTAGHIE